jgi:hypothetical protein
MSDLLKKMQAAFDRVNKEAVAGVYGQRYVPSRDSKDKSQDPEEQPDFPYVTDPDGYTTHVPLEQDEIREQGEDEAKIQKPTDAGEEAGANLETPSAEPEMPGGDEGDIGGMGMDAEGNMPGVGGDMGAMGEQEEELSSNQLGRVYELKKIYSRLSSVETFLSRTTDESILEVRKMVAQSIDLFELVISNYKQYKDKVDDIIVTYYEFLDVVYSTLKNHFSKVSKE